DSELLVHETRLGAHSLFPLKQNAPRRGYATWSVFMGKVWPARLAHRWILIPPRFTARAHGDSVRAEQASRPNGFLLWSPALEHDASDFGFGLRRGAVGSSHLFAGVEHQFQGDDGPIGAAAVDEFAAAAGHGLAFERIAEQVLNGGADGLRRDILVPAQAGGGTFLFEPLGVGPVAFVLQDHELGHADARQLQRPAAAAGEGKVAADDTGGDLGRLQGQFDAVLVGLGKIENLVEIAMVAADDDVDLADLGGTKQDLGQLQSLVVRIVLAQ